MKSVILQLLIFIVLSLSSLCSFAQGKQKIGFLMDDFNAPRWKYDSSLFAKNIRAAGNEILIRVCDSDTALQHQQAIELLKAGVKVLVVVPANSQAATGIVLSANKQKVPVIAYDRLILNCNLDYYVSFDAEKVGVLQADYILRKINYKGSVMIMNGPDTDANSVSFKKGQMSVLKPYIDNGAVKIIYDQYLSEWTSMESSMASIDFLGAYNGRIDGIIAANDAIAEGMLEALAIYRPGEKIYITGQDASVVGYKNILEGSQGMTIYKPIDFLAAQAAQLACKLAANGEMKPESTTNNGFKEVPFIKLDPIAITKENLESLLVESNYLSKEYSKVGK